MLGGGSSLEGKIRGSFWALLNLRCYQTSRWSCQRGSSGSTVEFRTEVEWKIGGEGRCEIVVQGSGALSNLRKCSMDAWRL